MIKVRNNELNNDTIQAINSIVDMEISAAAAFKISRIIKELSSIIEDKNAMERKIYDKYAEKDANGNFLPVFDENNQIVENALKITNMDKFNKDLNDLMNCENTLNYSKLKFEELNLDNNSKNKAKTFIILDFLFE